MVLSQRCLACGVQKDTTVKEVFPYPEDGFIDDPIDPFFTLHCEGPRVNGATDWRVVTVCHHCFHKLEPDMWISNRCWESLSPVTPFDQLPKLYAEQ